MMPAPKTAHQHFTRGGQITFHNLRMFCQVNKALFKWTAWGVVLLTLLMGGLIIDSDTFNGAKYRALFYIQSLFRSPDEWVTLTWHGETYQTAIPAIHKKSVIAVFQAL
jgi:hypothetical protein